MDQSFRTLHNGDVSIAHTHANKSRLEHCVSEQSALLFIDVSGFTKLSRSLEVESLSKVRRHCLCPIGIVFAVALHFLTNNNQCSLNDDR